MTCITVQQAHTDIKYEVCTAEILPTTDTHRDAIGSYRWCQGIELYAPPLLGRTLVTGRLVSFKFDMTIVIISIIIKLFRTIVTANIDYAG